MANNDALIAKTVDDAKNAKSNDASVSQHILDDIYDIKTRDRGDSNRLKSDYTALSNALHEQGLLPGLVINDSSAGSVTVTGADGKVQTLDTGAFGKTLNDPKKAGNDGTPGSDIPNPNQLPEGGHGGEGSADQLTRDNLGRVTQITNADGSVTTVEYDGLDKSPSKVTTIKQDGTTITYEKTGSNWTETTQPVGGAPVVNTNVDWVQVSNAGDVSTKDGSVTQVFHADGSVDVISQKDNGPKTKSHYQYGADGELTSVTRTNPDGSTDTFYSSRLFGWQMTSYDANHQKIDGGPVSNVVVNADGGFSYDAGNVHVDIEGYGAKHVTETTAYGSYEQSFDPSGKLTTVVRTDSTTGKTELISYINGNEGKLLVFDTNNPDSYSAYDVQINSDGSYSYEAQGIEVDRGVDFTEDGLKQLPLDPDFAEVAKENGVNVNRTIVDGKVQYEYSVESDGEHLVVLTSEGPAEADAQALQDLRDEKLAEVEGDYNVKFGKDGETTDVDGEQVPLRTPNLGQVYGVESALARSQPDVVTADGKPLEVDFTAVQGENENKGGFADGSRVVIEPNGGDDTPDQVMRVFMHELAHNGQHRLYGDDETFRTAYAAQFGFVKVGDDWLLQTKDGRYLKSIPGEGGVGSSGWVLTDKDGNPIDANGNPSNNPQKFTNEEARDLALVRPASGYFPNPAEAGAEATSKFRGGEQSRAEFLATNPDTYAVAKQLDQLDINKTYGLDANGQPKYIRNPDGILVENTPENQAAVEQFEDSVTSGDYGGIDGGLGNDGQKKDPKGFGLVDLKPGVDYMPALEKAG